MVSIANRLLGAIAVRGIKLSHIYRELNMTPSTWSRRIKGGGEDFTAAEINGLVDILGLSADEANTIFFLQENSQKCENMKGE